MTRPYDRPIQGDMTPTQERVFRQWIADELAKDQRKQQAQSGG